MCPRSAFESLSCFIATDLTEAANGSVAQSRLAVLECFDQGAYHGWITRGAECHGGFRLDLRRAARAF